MKKFKQLAVLIKLVSGEQVYSVMSFDEIKAKMNLKSSILSQDWSVSEVIDQQVMSYARDLFNSVESGNYTFSVITDTGQQTFNHIHIEYVKLSIL